MATDQLHLIKLCVGAQSVDDLIDWRQQSLAERVGQGLSPHMTHTTRMWPRRELELVNGGSLYWVIKGIVSVRQPIFGLEEAVGNDGIRRCRILLDPEFVMTEPHPKRPFQGWRYLKTVDAPRDLPGGAATIAPELATELAELGLL